MARVLEDEKIRNIIREEIASSLEKFFMKLRLLSLPEISDKEQKEIEKLYKRPSKKVKRTIKVDL